MFSKQENFLRKTMKEYKYLKYDGVKNSQDLTFREWFNLYSNIKNKINIPEEALDKPFRSIIQKAQ